MVLPYLCQHGRDQAAAHPLVLLRRSGPGIECSRTEIHPSRLCAAAKRTEGEDRGLSVDGSVLLPCRHRSQLKQNLHDQ